MPDRIRLDGKTAVITGAAGVIGAATVRLLAERGARIVAVDRRIQDLEAVIRDLPASSEALAVAADVTVEDDVACYVSAALDRFGSIDVFFNNAGIEGEVKPITEYSLAAFRRVLDVNVVGVFLGVKHVLAVMLKQNAGSIINTASIAGLIGSPQIAVYSASKHAVIGLTKSVAGGMYRHRRPGELRLPRPDREPHAGGDLRRPLRQHGDAAQGDRTRAGAQAWPGRRSRLHRGVPRLRRGELCLGLGLYRRWRAHCGVNIASIEYQARGNTP
jgi:NADP-dependent 3-hydroxy acid dehydrogenase YdfG